jgi:hypothetical protein
LAGKKAVFDVTILEASKRTLPELTDDFAEQVRSGLTVESLKEELKKAIDTEDAKEFTPARNAALAKALATRLEVEVPDTLVTNQAREKFALMMTDMRNNGVADEEIKRQINPDNFLKYKKIVKDDIVRDFKVSMATDEIARMENIEVPDYQVQEQLEAIKKDAGESGDEVDEVALRTKVEATLQRNAVMDFLAEHSKLQVEYSDVKEEQFNEALLEKIAQESLEREQQLAAAQAAAAEPAGESKKSTTNTSAKVEAKVAVEEPIAPKPVEATAEPAKPVTSEAPQKRDYSSMSVQDKAYYSLLDAGALRTFGSEEEDDDELA